MPHAEVFDRMDALLPRARAAAAEHAEKALREAVPDWQPNSRVELRARDAATIVPTYLSALELKLEQVTGPHDFAELLLLSRVCVGIVSFREIEKGVPHKRSQGADLWALARGRRGRAPNQLTAEERPEAFFGRLSDETLVAAGELYELAGRWQRAVNRQITFNFLRIYAGLKEGWPGPRIIFDEEGKLLLKGGSEEGRAFGEHFGLRYQYNRPFSRWGLGEFEEGEGDLKSSMVSYLDELPEGVAGAPAFEAHTFDLGKLLWLGRRFRHPFVTGTGMPPEHAAAIFLSLASLAEEYDPDEAWSNLTGLVPIPCSDQLSELLEEKIRLAVEQVPEIQAEEETLGRSVRRFIKRVRSSSLQCSFSATFSDSGGEFSARALWPPYLLHDDPGREVGFLDLSTTIAFAQRMVDSVVLSPTSRTTGSTQRDPYERTVAFDVELAAYLQESCGLHPALQEKRPLSAGPGEPNIVLKLSDSSEREIDVPLRVGSVLIPIQTWAKQVDKAIEEGDYRAMNRRWKRVREKLRTTDEHYAEEIADDPQSAAFLKEQGITHLLPLFVSPFAEPVPSTNPRYWLRPLVGLSREEASQAVPRILTAYELERFLNDADEGDLVDLARKIGRTL